MEINAYKFLINTSPIYQRKVVKNNPEIMKICIVSLQGK